MFTLFSDIADFLRLRFFYAFYKDTRTPDEKLESIKATVARLPEGRQLLDLAQELGVPIRLSALRRKKAGALGAYSPYTKEIFLDTDAPEFILVSVLFHELRHMWQYSRMDNVDKLQDLSMGANVAFTRLIEGDAWAFQKCIEKKLRGKAVTQKDWQDYFRGFQTGERGGAYGVNKIKNYLYMLKSYPDYGCKKGYLSDLFNVSALRTVVDETKILRMGLSDNDTEYLSFPDVQQSLLAQTSLSERMLAVLYHVSIMQKEQDTPKAPHKQSRLKLLRHAFRATQQEGPKVFERLPDSYAQRIAAMYRR